MKVKFTFSVEVIDNDFYNVKNIVEFNEIMNHETTKEQIKELKKELCEMIIQGHNSLTAKVKRLKIEPIFEEE